MTSERLFRHTQLLIEYFKHLTTMSVIGAAALLLLIEVQLVEASGWPIAGAVCFLFSAALGTMGHGQVIENYIEKERLFPKYKVVLGVMGGLIGLGVAALFISFVGS